MTSWYLRAEISYEPMLLGSGEILEGENQTVKSKKTTHKTITTKKETKEKQEPKE